MMDNENIDPEMQKVLDAMEVQSIITEIAGKETSNEALTLFFQKGARLKELNPVVFSQMVKGLKIV